MIELRISIWNKEKIILLLLKLISISNLVLFFSSSDKFYNEALFSLSSRLLLVVNLTIFFLVFVQAEHTKKFFISCMLLFLMIMEAYLSYMLNPAGSIMDFAILVSGYIAVPIYLLTISYIRIPKTALNWMKMISWIYMAFFLVMSIAFPSYRQATYALMLGYSNSNRTAAYMLLVVVLSVLVSQNEERKLLWWARKGSEAAMLFFIAATQSRTCLILALIAEIASLVPSLPKFGKKTLRMSIIAPAIFLWLYVWMYEQQWFIGAELLGKTIYSGRQLLFIEEMLTLSPFGHYAAGGFAGLNSAQSVLNTLGYVGLLLNYALYFRLTDSELFGSKDRNGTMAVICFALLMLHGCTEKMFTVAGSVYAGMIGCILLTIKAMSSIEE